MKLVGHRKTLTRTLFGLAGVALCVAGCRSHMPHALTWPAGGDIVQTHPKPPEGGYYTDWDPWAVGLELTPGEDTNPVRTQHIMIATVLDKHGVPLPNRRVEWILSRDGVGDIVEVDESGFRASRGYKVSNTYAVSHTNNFDHVLTRGNDDPSDDVHIKAGQTWCVITSPVEGDTHITAYAPGIHDWDNHKVFAVKHWYDVDWEFPPSATNPVGTDHQFVTQVTRFSDGTPLEGYEVTYTITGGPAGSFRESNGTSASVRTDTQGLATVTLVQSQPAEGTNPIKIDVVRSPNEACCEPSIHIASGETSKTWVAPKIAISKTAPAREVVNNQFQYNIEVSNTSSIDATDVVVTDTLPNGIQYVSSNPSATVSGQSLSWSLGTLPGQRKAPIAVTVTGTRQGTFTNCADVTANMGLRDRDCAETVISAPALQLEKSGPDVVSICEPIEYLITVRNTGDGTAKNVQITDELPDGMSSKDGKRTLIFNAGTLEAGQAKQARFSVKADRTGTFTNRATAKADGGLTADAQASTRVVQPVLEVTKQCPGTRFIGRPAEFQITVRNTGDAAARNTILTDQLPAGAELLSASDNAQRSGNSVQWNLGTLEAGATRTVTVSLKAMQPGTMRNSVTARATCAEASDSCDMEVKGIPAVLLEVIDVDDPIEIGSNETYVITVTNQGSAVGTNIRIVCTLPPEQDFVSAAGAAPGTAAGKVVTFAPLPSLAPKAKATFRVVSRGNAEGDTRFRVSMTTDQTTSPVDETESTHIY